MSSFQTAQGHAFCKLFQECLTTKYDTVEVVHWATETLNFVVFLFFLLRDQSYITLGRGGHWFQNIDIDLDK